MHIDLDTEDARVYMTGTGIIEALMQCLETAVDIHAITDLLQKIAHDGERFKTTWCLRCS